MVNYYLELELNSALSTAELDQALKKLSMKWRQRVNAPSLEARQEAERKVQMINEARNILLDEQKRAQYDDQLARTTKETKQVETEKQEVVLDEETVAEQLRILQAKEDNIEIIKLINLAYNYGIGNGEFCWAAGQAWIEVDDLNQAVVWFRRSIGIEPDNYRSYTSLAFIAEWQEDYGGLKQCLDWLVEHHHDDNSWIAGMRMKYYMKAGEEAAAYGVIQQYIRSNPTDIKFIIILNIENQGAAQIKATDPTAVSIFILPPSAQELRRRLVDRKSETPEQVEKRMAKGKEQMQMAYAYDFVVMNDDLDAAVEDVVHIISTVRRRTMLHKELIDQINATFAEE